MRLVSLQYLHIGSPTMAVVCLQLMFVFLTLLSLGELGHSKLYWVNPKENNEICAREKFRASSIKVHGWKSGDPQPCPAMNIRDTSKVKLDSAMAQISNERFKTYATLFFFGKGPAQLTVEAQCGKGRRTVIGGPVAFTVYQCRISNREKVLKETDDKLNCVDTDFGSSEGEVKWEVPSGVETNVTKSGSVLSFPRGFTRGFNGEYVCTYVLPEPWYTKIITKYTLKAMEPPKSVILVSHTPAYMLNDTETLVSDKAVSLKWTDRNGKLEGGLIRTEVEWRPFAGGQWKTLNDTLHRGSSHTVSLDVDRSTSYTVKITPITGYGRGKPYLYLLPSSSLEDVSKSYT